MNKQHPVKDEVEVRESKVLSGRVASLNWKERGYRRSKKDGQIFLLVLYQIDLRLSPLLGGALSHLVRDGIYTYIFLWSEKCCLAVGEKKRSPAAFFILNRGWIALD